METWIQEGCAEKPKVEPKLIRLLISLDGVMK